MAENLVQKIAILGAGSWGTAFAKVVAEATDEKGQTTEIFVWGRNPEYMETCQREHRNSRYFPETELPESIRFTSDFELALTGAAIVVVALPSQVIREQLRSAVQYIEDDAVLVSLAKGLEQGTGLRMSQVITEVLVEHAQELSADETARLADRVAVLSGPNLAREIVAKEPTASVVAANETDVADTIATACANSYFRPYTSHDVVGVEVGGLGKNVIALCVGICAGMGYGDNSRASIMTRGLAETTRLAVALGGDPLTMSGLAGMGDLVATCSSPLSRNHTAGKLIASGIAPDQLHTHMTQTAEAVKSAPVLAELAHKHNIEMPITEAVTAVLSNKISIDELAPRLLGRSLKREQTVPDSK